MTINDLQEKYLVKDSSSDEEDDTCIRNFLLELGLPEKNIY